MEGRLLVNGEPPNHENDTEIRKELKTLYKDELVEIALQYRHERNLLNNEIETLTAYKKAFKDIKKFAVEWRFEILLKFIYELEKELKGETKK